MTRGIDSSAFFPYRDACLLACRRLFITHLSISVFLTSNPHTSKIAIGIPETEVRDLYHAFEALTSSLYYQKLFTCLQPLDSGYAAED